MQSLKPRVWLVTGSIMNTTPYDRIWSNLTHTREAFVKHNLVIYGRSHCIKDKVYAKIFEGIQFAHVTKWHFTSEQLHSNICIETLGTDAADFTYMVTPFTLQYVNFILWTNLLRIQKRILAHILDFKTSFQICTLGVVGNFAVRGILHHRTKFIKLYKRAILKKRLFKPFKWLLQWGVNSVISIILDVLPHYNDTIMGTMASQITSLTIVYSTVYSRADRRKHQSHCGGIHLDRWIPRT